MEVGSILSVRVIRDRIDLGLIISDFKRVYMGCVLCVWVFGCRSGVDISGFCVVMGGDIFGVVKGVGE